MESHFLLRNDNKIATAERVLIELRCSAKRVRYATYLCPCLGAFLKKHAETGYTY